MRIASLGSGSRGNATLVQHNDTVLLIDNGFSLKQFSLRLQRLELEPSAIDGLLLTHEHGDHSGGAQKLCEKHGIRPTYLVDTPVVENDYGASLLNDYQQALWEFARRDGRPAVNMVAELEPYDHAPLFLDHVHPTEAGHRLIAEALLPVAEGAGLVPGTPDVLAADQGR